MLVVVAIQLGCASTVPLAGGVRIASAPPPSSEEDYCAWYGDARDGVLYFGVAPFWSAMRAAGGDPRADLQTAGPQLVGRFDLAREQLLPALEVGGQDSRSGVWDVHAHENGRVYFTTFYESMGSVEPATGDVEHYPALGLGLNEIAPAADGNLLVTRYGAAGEGDDRRGSLLVIAPDGSLLAEYPIDPPAGFEAAPKTPAWHARRREYWTTNDLIPTGTAASAKVETDASVLDASGKHARRVSEPEVQFVAALPDGAFARIENARGELRLIRDEGGSSAVLLDPAFTASLDFAQDLKPTDDGGTLTTRWSGWVHLAERDGTLRSLRLPSVSEGGLYYSAVRRGERICATHCGGVEVVCADLP